MDANDTLSGNQKFNFLGSSGFTSAPGEVRVTTYSSNQYLVLIDTDRDSAAEASILVHSLTALVKGDFVL